MPSDAILLLGPPGSGKTPLGRLLADRGLWGRPCRHFDFGQCLRRIADRPGGPDGLDPAELGVVRSVLAAGTLLEERDLPIARKVLTSFLRRTASDDRTWVVLNGLPRDVGQARGVAGLVGVSAVVGLECSPRTVFQRIALNTGGDRIDRTDDDLEAVRRRLDVFAARTAPLAEYYRTTGARVLTVDVHADTTASEMLHVLDERGPAGAVS